MPEADPPRDLRLRPDDPSTRDGTFPMPDLDQVPTVDERATELPGFVLGSRRFEPRSPLPVSIRFDRDAQLYEGEGPFGIFVAASTRPELEEQLRAEVPILWHEYAEADPNTLTGDAQDLRRQLRDAFAPVGDAD